MQLYHISDIKYIYSVYTLTNTEGRYLNNALQADYAE